MKLVNLSEIEGVISPHSEFLKYQSKLRSKYFKGVKNVEDIAKFVGGEKVDLKVGETWCIKKEIFPEVEIYIIFYEAEEEFEEDIKVIFGGERVKNVPGEDLSSLAIFVINHLIRKISS